MDWYRPCPHLSLSVPPILEPVEFQNDVMAAQGSEVVLPCEARGSPLPLVSWMKDGEPLLRQSLEPGSGLKLEAVSIGDSGTYSCMAASEAGEARRHFQLTVMGGCLVLGSLSGWRVRWDSGAEKKASRAKGVPWRFGVTRERLRGPCLQSYCG